MRKLLLIIIFFSAIPSYSQDLPDFNAVDSLYREDQFYIKISYNILTDRPAGVKQNKFSSGFAVGFLRDMPINESRTWSIAAGLGYAISNYNINLLVDENDGVISYSVDNKVTLDKNKIILNYVELPIELRWRTSTPESHRFWRIYTGVKVGYLIFDKYKFENSDAKFSVTNNPDLNKLQYGATLSVGYNTWNANVYYGLNPIFKSATLNTGDAINFRALNIGLMFYIL